MSRKNIRVGDIDISFLDEGAGPVLLCVHGFPLDGEMWREQIAGLKDSARLIAPDLRGFGQTSVTPGKVTMEQMADDLASLLRILRIEAPVTLCGLSMGGYVAWQFWRRHVPRLAALVLCDTRAVADTPEAAQTRLKMAEHVLKKGTHIVAEAMLPKMFAATTQTTRPKAIDYVREVILRTQPEGIAAAQRGMAERPDVTSWLSQIGVPALVIVGEHDEISPVAEMQSIADALPRAELAVIPDAGHMAPLENPAAVNDALRRFMKLV